MCQFSWVLGFASVSGVIQSILWMSFGLLGALVYLCLIPVNPYESTNDFFRVTLVKLYFEGPDCIPDGSYLGTFEEKYKTATTFTNDKIFALMTVYAILNGVYLILSILLYKDRKRVSQRLALSWSVMTLIFCCLDLYCVLNFIYDFFELTQIVDDLQNTAKNIQNVVYIPLIMAVVSSRLFFGWLMNVFLGFFIFFDALCCRKVIRKPVQVEEEKEKIKPEKVVEVPRDPEFVQPPVSVINGNIRSYFDIATHPDFLDYKKSMEAVTRFNNPDSSMSVKEGSQRNWVYAPTEVSWHPKSHTSREWEMTNEGYVSDEGERNVDFDHNLKNFEPGQRKIKIVRPPPGKPVSIPVPPPLPPSGSCNC